MNTREPDLEELRRDWKTADEQQRRMIEKAAQNIRKESGKIRNMREALVKEHRQGNKGNIADIHEYIRHKAEYQNAK